MFFSMNISIVKGVFSLSKKDNFKCRKIILFRSCKSCYDHVSQCDYDNVFKHKGKSYYYPCLICLRKNTEYCISCFYYRGRPVFY